MAHQRVDRVLGHRVGDLEGIASDRRAGRGVDHRPAALIEHHRQRGLRREHVAFGVDREGAVEHLLGAVERVDVALGAAREVGVVEIEGAEFVERGLHDGGLRGGAGAVEIDTQRLAASGADALRGFLRPVLGDVADHDAGALLGQPPRGRRADPAPATCDHPHLALQSAHLFSFGFR